MINLIGRKIIDQGIYNSELLKEKFPYIVLDDGHRIYLDKEVMG